MCGGNSTRVPARPAGQPAGAVAAAPQLDDKAKNLQAALHARCRSAEEQSSMLEQWLAAVKADDIAAHTLIQGPRRGTCKLLQSVLSLSVILH